MTQKESEPASFKGRREEEEGHGRREEGHVWRGFQREEVLV